MNTPARILLLPGWMMPAAVFEPCIEQLPRPGSTIEALNWTAALDPAALAAAVARGPGECWAVGWSLGAIALLKLALRPPANLTRLVLLGATARLPAAEGYEGVAPNRLAAMRRRLQRDPEGLLRDFHRLCHAPHEAPPSNLDQWLARALQTPRDLADAGLALLAEADLRTALGRVRTPTTLLHGASDAVVPHAQAHFLAEAIPNCRLHMLPQSGHWPTPAAWQALRDIL